MKTTFAALALAGAATASPVLRSNKWTPRALSGLNYDIINLARNLESLELNYWGVGMKNYTAQDFDDAGYVGFYDYLELFRTQEVAHFTTLNNLLGGGFTNCTYTFPVTNVTEFIALGQVVTTVGEGAFIGGVANITNSDVRQTGGGIIGNEARQNSLLRQYQGIDYFNAPNFDTPLTASQAYSLAKPLFNCPSSNPPINFHLIPPIMAAFQNGDTPHFPGDVIDVMWDSSTVYLGEDVHIQFLSDVNSIASPLLQTGDGMGTVVLPAKINGTAILSATNFNGAGPIPDNQNFGIGYVIVA